MGAWGYGLLKNDAIQDDIVAVADRRPTEASAARLGSAVGLLLHLSSGYSYDPANAVAPVIGRAIEHHRPKLAALPERARRLLRDVADGRGSELADRPGRLSKPVHAALCGPRTDEPTMEWGLGKREPSLFARPAAARYVQTVADRCVARVDEDFADDDVVGDLSHEARGMGAFGALLVISPCRVSVARVRRWQAAYCRVTAALATEGNEDEDFDRQYNACLDVAFRLMVRRWSKV